MRATKANRTNAKYCAYNRMVRYKQPKSIIPNVPADEFFKNFVSRRRPAIIKGLLDDEAFKARQWVCYIGPGIQFLNLTDLKRQT